MMLLVLIPLVSASFEKQNVHENVPDGIELSLLNEPKPSLSRSARSAPAVVRPEVLVVVDGSLYQRTGKEVSTTRKYIISFFSKVDNHFKSLSNPRISLHLSDIVILETPASPPYLNSSILPPRKNGSTIPSLQATKALDLMGKHYYNSSNADLVITLLYLDLCRGTFCDIVGKTYTGGACIKDKRLKKSKSVAIVEDNGYFSGVKVAVHELAHLLGAVHDGYYGAAECSKEGFIMSERKIGAMWSQCSRRRIRDFVTSRDGRCMYNSPGNSVTI